MVVIADDLGPPETADGLGPPMRTAAARRGVYPDCDDITAQNVETVVKLEDAAKAKRTGSDRVADAISGFCGSITFVWAHVLWFGGWVVLNVLPQFPHFDPLPFSFLTLIVSLEAIFLSTFILISENRQARLDERRNHLDLQINLLAEQENTKMIELLARIADHLGIEVRHDPEVKALEQATDADRLVKQIDASIAKSEAQDP
jgi:uncharacterized membrane protein